MSSARSPVSTSSSSAAAPRTSRPGSRGAARGRSGSTRLGPSSPRPGAARSSSASSSRWSRQRRGDPLPDASFDLAVSEYGASIWCDPTAGSPRPPASCGPVVDCVPRQQPLSVSAAAGLRTIPVPTASCAPCSACIVSSGPASSASTSPAARRDDPPPARDRLRGQGAPYELQAPDNGATTRITHVSTAEWAARGRRGGVGRAEARVSGVTDLDVVTGAFSFTGRYIAAALLERGRKVRTLRGAPGPVAPARRPGWRRRHSCSTTGSPRACAGRKRSTTPTGSASSAAQATFDRAVANIGEGLVRAAASVGVRAHRPRQRGRCRGAQVAVPVLPRQGPRRRILVRAAAQRRTRSSGPRSRTGPERLLVNNIAWALRRVPVFLLPVRTGRRPARLG